MINKSTSNRRLTPSVSFKTECNSRPISAHTSNETTPSMLIKNSITLATKKSNSKPRSNTPHLKNLNSSNFNLPKRYTNLSTIGEGSYGVVCMAYDQRRDVNVAIRKISPVSNSCVDSKHVLREMRLMRYLGKHDNIVGLVDMIADESEDAVYIIMDLLDSDLHKLIISPQVLNEKHLVIFMVQVLRGLAYIHEAGIVHRDIKPANILVTRDCQVCLTDFGFARVLKSMINPKESNDLTPHVVTRWYRPPELMLSPKKDYDCSIDMWSVGCTFAELINRKPLFPGSNFMDQLALIFDLIGSPAEDEITHIRGQSAKNFLQSIKHKKRKSFKEVLPTASLEAIDLIEKMLVFDPTKRITAKEALMHPFFEGIGKESFCPPPAKQELTFEFDFPGNNIDSLKCSLFHEIKDFKVEQACKGIDDYNEPLGEIINPIFTMELSPPSACLRVPERSEYFGNQTTKRNGREKSIDEISYFTKYSGISCKENVPCNKNGNNCENCNSSNNSKNSQNENVSNNLHMRCKSAAIPSKSHHQDEKLNKDAPPSPSSRIAYAFNKITVAPAPIEKTNRSIHFRAKSLHLRKSNSSASCAEKIQQTSGYRNFFSGKKLNKNYNTTESLVSSNSRHKKSNSERDEEMEFLGPYAVNGKIIVPLPHKGKHSRKSSFMNNLKFPLGQYFNKRWNLNEK